MSALLRSWAVEGIGVRRKFATRKHSESPGRRGCSSAPKRLRANEDALLAPGPNFKTVRSPAIKLSGRPLESR
jgi:hypothetical protein